MTPEQQLLASEEYFTIQRLLDSLPPREGLAVRWHFGFSGKPMTLRAIGERFGISHERARQIICRAQRRLRCRARGYFRERFRIEQAQTERHLMPSPAMSAPFEPEPRYEFSPEAEQQLRRIWAEFGVPNPWTRPLR